MKLGKLICLYDDNSVTLSAATEITFSEDRAKRFEAYGWQTISIADGNDLDALNAALGAARAEIARPSLILVRTHLGFGSPVADSFKAHGSPLGAANVAKTKQRLGWPVEPAFFRAGASPCPISRGARTRCPSRVGMDPSHGSLCERIP